MCESCFFARSPTDRPNTTRAHPEDQHLDTFFFVITLDFELPKQPQIFIMVLLRPHRCHEPGDTVSMLKWQTADQHLNTVSWVAQIHSLGSLAMGCRACFILSSTKVEPVAPSRRADSRQSKRRRTQSEGKQSRQTQPHGFAANQKGNHR